MKNWNRFLILLLTVTMVFLALPFEVSANSPAPTPWYSVELENLPAGTAYVDMLIYLPVDDPMYTELEETNLPESFSKKAEIILYCEGDYRSYTFHYRNAMSVIEPGSQMAVKFLSDETETDIRYAHADDIVQRGDIRLAMLDRMGDILKVSPLFSLDTNEFMVYTLGTYRYDAATDAWEAQTAVSSWGFLQFLVASILGVILTCFSERLIAWLFRIDRKYGQMILTTNLISQILMRLAVVAFYSLVFWKYNYAVLVLELCVYVGEYLVYCRIMGEIPWKRRLAFVICANTVSLVLGSTANYLILFN